MPTGFKVLRRGRVGHGERRPAPVRRAVGGRDGVEPDADRSPSAFMSQMPAPCGRMLGGVDDPGAVGGETTRRTPPVPLGEVL